MTLEAQQSRLNKERLEDVIRREEKDLSHMKHSFDKCKMDIEVGFYYKSCFNTFRYFISIHMMYIVLSKGFHSNVNTIRSLILPKQVAVIVW
jgi:hypothetical protein